MTGRSIHGKTALITGGAQRIGRTTALAFAQEGANVLVHYNRSRGEADALCDEIRMHGVQAWSVQADFAQPDEYTALLPRALELAESIDILVNNASIFPANQLANLSLDAIHANIEINAWVPFLLTREFAQRVGHGSVVNMLDSRLKGYDWNHVAYMLSKHVLAVLTRMAALEYAPHIAVNAVAPGLILPPPGKDEQYLDALVQTVPMHRHGNPQDIADAVVFLAKSEFCTGEVIYVDGGRHLQEYLGGPNIH